MNLKYHKALNKEKWSSFPLYKQVLMIANELNRAGNWIEKNDFSEAKLCYERALELIYLTIAVLKNVNKLREFLRFKEMLCMLYIKDSLTKEENTALLKALVSLDKDSFSVLQS